MSIYIYMSISLYKCVPGPPKGPRATLLFDLPRSPGCKFGEFEPWNSKLIIL